MAYYNNYNFDPVSFGSGLPVNLYYGQHGSTERTQRAGAGFSQIFAAKSRKNSTASLFDSLPTSMNAIFEEAASRFGVDANLLKAIGKAESAFNASAVSQAGAIGVMQLMPATAAALGVSNPYDARENIMGGASYIADLLKKYGGDVKLALAAYNAGSGNVDKYGGIPPFKETQSYVKKVMEYAGEDITVNGTVSQAASQQYESGETVPMQAVQADSGYLSNLVDLMRIQMEMKLTSILSDVDGEF